LLSPRAGAGPLPAAVCCLSPTAVPVIGSSQPVVGSACRMSYVMNAIGEIGIGIGPGVSTPTPTSHEARGGTPGRAVDERHALLTESPGGPVFYFDWIYIFCVITSYCYSHVVSTGKSCFPGLSVWYAGGSAGGSQLLAPSTGFKWGGNIVLYATWCPPVDHSHNSPGIESTPGRGAGCASAPPAGSPRAPPGRPESQLEPPGS
jgi:hypothetical protein